MHDTAILDAPTAEPEVDANEWVSVGRMVVRLSPAMKFDSEQLVEFCRLNSDLRIERSAKGDLIIMAPAFGNSGRKNAKLTAAFVYWASVQGGEVFDSSAGFILPDQSLRSPDVSWIAPERFAQLSEADLESFTPMCPDFVLELRSSTDRLPRVHEKMVEYIENGARLGWLVDPLEKQVFVYRPGQQIEHLLNPGTLSGEPVLAGFTLDLTRVW